MRSSFLVASTSLTRPRTSASTRRVLATPSVSNSISTRWPSLASARSDALGLSSRARSILALRSSQRLPSTITLPNPVTMPLARAVWVPPGAVCTTGTTAGASLPPPQAASSPAEANPASQARVRSFMSFSLGGWAAAPWARPEAELPL